LTFGWEEEDINELGEGKPWGPLARAHRAALDLLRQAILSGQNGRHQLEERLNSRIEEAVKEQIRELSYLINKHGSLAEAMSNAITMGTLVGKNIVEMRDKMT
jgi:hypothetical protein